MTLHKYINEEKKKTMREWNDKTTKYKINLLIRNRVKVYLFRENGKNENERVNQSN